MKKLILIFLKYGLSFNNLGFLIKRKKNKSKEETEALKNIICNDEKPQPVNVLIKIEIIPHKIRIT